MPWHYSPSAFNGGSNRRGYLLKSEQGITDSDTNFDAAQALALLRKLKKAKLDWEKAIEIASMAGHSRLRREAERDMQSWLR